MEIREQQIRRWFNCWLERDGSAIPRIFSADAYYSECYGPEYCGIDEISKWFSTWNQENRVLRWEIREFVHGESVTAVEWEFSCRCAGEESGFNGISLVEFDRLGKICSLKEFSSKAEHIRPYGKQPENVR